MIPRQPIIDKTTSPASQRTNSCALTAAGNRSDRSTYARTTSDDRHRLLPRPLMMLFPVRSRRVDALRLGAMHYDGLINRRYVAGPRPVLPLRRISNSRRGLIVGAVACAILHTGSWRSCVSSRSVPISTRLIRVRRIRGIRRILRRVAISRIHGIGTRRIGRVLRRRIHVARIRRSQIPVVFRRLRISRITLIHCLRRPFRPRPAHGSDNRQ